MTTADLVDFAKCYKSGARQKRRETERFKSFACDDLLARDKTNLDIFWLKDDTLEDVDALPAPDPIGVLPFEHSRPTDSRLNRMKIGGTLFEKTQ